MIRAAIDLGTVTSRLMIGEVAGGAVSIKERNVIITNLGEGLAESGVISDAAYARLLAALMQFREEIVDAQTKLLCEGAADIAIPVKIVATSAMRDAKNAGEILEELADLGFDLEVISGAREAELSFKGTLSGFTGLQSPVLSIDVGGGSTELILGTAALEIGASHSFDIGSRRVTELFLKSDPPTAAELSEARAWIDAQIAPYVAALPARPAEILAVAGTATSAITVRDGIDEFESSLVHGKRITLDELQAVLDRLAALPLEERMLVAGLEPGRAPVIVGGLIVLFATLAATGKNDLMVSDTDILQGILLDTATIC